MSLTITKEYFFKNFEKEDNQYVGKDIDSSSARTFDFKYHQDIIKEIKEICEDSPLKINRMKNIVAVCFNILIENKRDISKIQKLKDLFKQFTFFMATTSENEIYYECPCTQPNLYELDWFNLINTDEVFYVGSECVNKFGDENFQTDHKKKLKEQLVQFKIDSLLKKLKVKKDTLLYFVKFNYPEIYESLKNSDSLIKSQLERLEKEINLNWSIFFKLTSSSNDVVGQYVRDHKKVFRHYLELVDAQYQDLFTALLRKRKLSFKQLNALGVSGKIILKKARKL